MTDDERIIREALQAGPTPGPWKSSGDVTGAVGPLFVATMAYEGDERRIVARIENRESARPLDNEDFANAAVIAACSPDRIERMLAELERLRAERARLERECDARDTTIRILDEERDKLRAELAEAQRDAEHLRSESVTLAGILRDCYAVLGTIEPDSTAEADSMADLRRAIAYALDPYGNTDNLPGVETRRRIVFACPVCAASLERTP